MKHNYLCPICGEGILHPEVRKNPVEYRGHTAELDLHFFICDTCGSEQMDSNQSKTNKDLMTYFENSVDVSIMMNIIERNTPDVELEDEV